MPSNARDGRRRAALILIAAMMAGWAGCSDEGSADASAAGAAHDQVDQTDQDAGTEGDDGVGGDRADTRIGEDLADASEDTAPDGPVQDSAPPDDAQPLDPEVLEPTVKQTTRVGFQYVGSNGASHYLDDVVVEDTTKVQFDEGFEGGDIPEAWVQRIQRAFFSWEIVEAAHEAHDGDFSAKVVWNENQDEWLVSPPIDGDGSYTLTFWNKGVVDLAPAATLHVHYSCNDGLDWHEIYVFPGAGETENYVWYENELTFECP